jgi:hypothetical protein
LCAPGPPPDPICSGNCDTTENCAAVENCICVRTRKQRRNNNPGTCRTFSPLPPTCPAECLCGCPDGSTTCIPLDQCPQGPCPAGCPCGCPAGVASCIPVDQCPSSPAPPDRSRQKKRKKGGSGGRASGRGCETNRQCQSNKCQRGKCCDPKGNHCRSDSECCSGKCEWVHSPDRPSNPDEDRQCA